MLRRFWNDKRGNYAMMMVVAMIPILGGLALAIDYGEVSRQRQETLNALDAAGIATAKRIQEGASDADSKIYAKSFFEANLRAVAPENTQLTVLLPNQNVGSGTLKLTAALKYKPFFYPAFAALLGNKSSGSGSGSGGGSTIVMDFSATTEVKLQDTIELAMVLDNSGSMSELGKGSSKVRLDLLKTAAKQLVDTMNSTAAQMKQIAKPVQVGIVPFAGSVNVGPANAGASWMDATGISPVHHENFAWGVMPSGYEITQVVAGGPFIKTGKNWPVGQKDTIVTRFSLFNELKYTTSSNTKAQYASWLGCVEARPTPYDANDTAPAVANPATLFVPMFAPDEPSGSYNDWVLYTKNNTTYYWSDVSTSSSGSVKQSYMRKYFDNSTWGYSAPKGTVPATANVGPNLSCTTGAITPLTDVSTTPGKDAIKASIDAMQPNGSTNVPEGMAWGWRVVSSTAPFTGGREESHKGNDKVVIVITDGENTYYETSTDPAGNKSRYAAYGYAGKITTGYTKSRIFQGTTAPITYTSSNYTNAMNLHFDTLCANAKAAGIIVMTVALDLDAKNTAEKAQMDRLKACASFSKFRKDASGNPEKNYWNTTGQDLSATFKLIANELSNLRIVG